VISVSEVVLSPDLTAPEPFQVIRTTGRFVAGGFQPLQTTTIELIGPVQQASNREIQMLPEADRVGSIRSFWSTIPLYLTRGTAPVPSTQGQVPGGAVPGTVYALDQAHQSGDLYLNGLYQTPGVDYELDGSVIIFTVQTPPEAGLWFQWPVTVQVQAAYSDVLVYGGLQYRVLQVYHDPGCGYWKALGTRLTAA
jgi:hypothetical protein